MLSAELNIDAFMHGRFSGSLRYPGCVVLPLPSRLGSGPPGNFGDAVVTKTARRSERIRNRHHRRWRWTTKFWAKHPDPNLLGNGNTTQPGYLQLPMLSTLKSSGNLSIVKTISCQPLKHMNLFFFKRKYLFWNFRWSMKHNVIL